MKTAPLPPNEKERLEAVRQTEVLDTPPEAEFDRLTDLAAKICQAPIALITLVDVDRQWFKSHLGIDVSETPRDVAFCAHTILQPDIMVVKDALEDERFADNPLVTKDPKIRFYAGCPLITYDDHALGTFCVIDTVPRELGSEHATALRTLARHATAMLELRRAKELLKSHAEEWEQAADPQARSQALAKLGQDLKEMVVKRERAELSFRDLERDLHRLAPVTPASSEGTAPEIGRLLGELVEGFDRMLGELGPDHPLRAETERMSASARRARAMFTQGDGI